MSNLERRLINIGGSIIFGFNLLFNTQIANANDFNLSKIRAEAYYQYVETRKHHLKHIELLKSPELDNNLKTKIKDAILKNYRGVLRLDGNSSDLLADYGEALMDFERYKEAEIYLRKALKLNEYNKRAYNELISLYKIKERPDEIEALEVGYGYRFIEE